jgi:hypothetical protein
MFSPNEEITDIQVNYLKFFILNKGIFNYHSIWLKFTIKFLKTEWPRFNKHKTIIMNF